MGRRKHIYYTYQRGRTCVVARLASVLIVFIRKSLIARRTRSNFALRKSEAAELDRAVLLYDKACSRIKEINEREGPPTRLWRAFLARPANITEQDIDELEELEAHAQHLRATIVRLTNQPLRRLRSWVRVWIGSCPCSPRRYSCAPDHRVLCF